MKDRLCALYYRAFPDRVGALGLDSMFFFGNKQAKTFDWGRLAQEQAMEHLLGCYEALEARDEDLDAEVDDPSYAPFCGCTVCEVREVLYAAWGVIANATRAGVEFEYTRDHD